MSSLSRSIGVYINLAAIDSRDVILHAVHFCRYRLHRVLVLLSDYFRWVPNRS